MLGLNKYSKVVFSVWDENVKAGVEVIVTESISIEIC